MRPSEEELVSIDGYTGQNNARPEQGELMSKRFNPAIAFVVAVGIGCLLPNAALERTRKVKCDKGQSLQKKIDRAKPGDTILIRGTCNENVTIAATKSNLLLMPEEGGDAVLQGQAGSPTTIN